MIDEKLYKELEDAVEKIGERIRQKERDVFPKLAVTNISEVGKNNKEVVVRNIIGGDILSGKIFNTLLLVGEEKLLKMRKKKYFFFKSGVVPKALLKVTVDSQKVFCTIYDPAVPEWTVKEGLKEFVRLHEGVEEFIIVKNFMVN
ncbi:MAG: hypothetical protein KAQ87_04165 [Candidatus Pacebacteria bacterium]|nr:hypothetical protein [Candidatus Paceibacterota bacterium]